MTKFLSDLDLEKIDCLMFHKSSDYFNLQNKNVLNKLKNNNKINKIGISIYDNFEALQILNDSIINVVQLPYNNNYNQRGEIIKN